MKELTKQQKFDKIFLDLAVGMSGMSHCIRTKVGAVITLANRVVSTGYNGTPPGFENCDEHFEPIVQKRCEELLPKGGTADRWRAVRKEVLESPEFKQMHADWMKHEVHAEANSLLFAAKNGVSVDGGTVYCTISPCMDCAKLLAAAGIKRVVYLQPYHRDVYPISFLKECGIRADHFIF